MDKQIIVSNLYPLSSIYYFPLLKIYYRLMNRSD